MKSMPETTRHDPAAGANLAPAFEAGRNMVGEMKGSQSQYQRVSLPVSVGSANGQPALQGMIPHPIPPPKGDRW